MSRKRHQSGSTDGRVIYSQWSFLGFEWRSDLIAHDYMRRWTFFTPWKIFRLHHILRSDSREHFHDHPMDFRSFVLKGGYIEHTPNNPPRRCSPGSVVVRRAEDLHYLELLNTSAWTFLVTGPIRRDWGFQTEEGWVRAGDYDAWLKKRSAKQ